MSLPSADHAAPEVLDPIKGLVVHHRNRDGIVRDYDFATLPGTAALQRSLAALFAIRSHAWGSHGSSEKVFDRPLLLRCFARHPQQREVGQRVQARTDLVLTQAEALGQQRCVQRRFGQQLLVHLLADRIQSQSAQHRSSPRPPCEPCDAHLLSERDTTVRVEQGPQSLCGSWPDRAMERSCQRQPLPPA
ncbi:hypothetical protein [Kitasatospora kifunensis]|uniref:Uncharacterized protein n=1 Tax=Kitasatospora kifunensis TaxID=58351 RepID=A0A7W7VZE1_KITKI|nr:hypothetical protein [Kitasatospora kifunensis]MBB4928471.1 hypothetical protein [Kitasatospora kifunensis]